jgi:hypothetical protein
MRTGRPSKFTKAAMDKAKRYLKTGYVEQEDPFPSRAGLACYLDIGRATVQRWSEAHEEFRTLLDKIQTVQERMLLSGGLNGDFNSTIAKLVLTKHGYSDKSEVEQTVKIDKIEITPI